VLLPQPCPFCNTMFQDALAARGEDAPELLDIAQLWRGDCRRNSESKQERFEMKIVVAINKFLTAMRRCASLRTGNGLKSVSFSGP